MAHQSCCQHETVTHGCGTVSPYLSMPVCRVDLVTPADVVGHDRTAAGDALGRAFD